MIMEKLWNRPFVQDYNRYMGYVDKSDHMMNSYCVSSSWTWKWTKKTFLHLLDLTVLNSFIILTSCGSKLSHWHFRLTLVRALVQVAGRMPQPQTTRQRRQAPSTSQIQRLDLGHDRHWLIQCKRILCHVCCTKNIERRTKYKCLECSIVLCASPHFEVYHSPHFEVYHTKLHFENQLTL